jgi:hypothetical protein
LIFHDDTIQEYKSCSLLGWSHGDLLPSMMIQFKNVNYAHVLVGLMVIFDPMMIQFKNINYAHFLVGLMAIFDPMMIQFKDRCNKRLIVLLSLNPILVESKTIFSI